MLLELKQISKNFGGLQVLQGVDFNVREGEIFGLIGPNGAGKTTVFNLITGLLRASSGSIAFNGEDIGEVAPHKITERGIARTFQNIRVFKEMTLLENVVVGMHDHLNYGVAGMLFNLGGFRKAEQEARERALELLSWVRLEHKAHMLADSLSYGEQRKLEFARALATRPRLLLLDEPVAGMNPAEKTELMAEIVNIKERGFTIFMIEHDMRFVMGLCERIAVLNFGKIIAEGTPDQIKNNQEVIEAYLGKEEA
ncbi:MULTISPECIES: ABC transporter ATP-binding protein [unclassified Herbaspirillum]|uniref:ABC transporter ATP-binding protein n=1 Tax=unclassified Herbaspirillum TaxID=2624150 RepID=UPI001153ACAB|nr:MULTISPECIES: ABC transporter ATP-binding protein [unclassified Herbaspirillum]MBB5393558.1 branched-chain amino acid transport system ATP-binding protein [Herbaspirillum sp. SJZ102]TQK03694.1 amino acid/amide ABC transporter ATP-binding protein 1 (HAAT family) [Herbaspirillum sp. SJZ130]TQK08426.1 amino acid/amide ABC transporter ATP-binding protein 1 (HAAT family) [Herbaspirillum sp. SJZ106]TWC71689.1 amino acid/amide ABC transporter ATP-binding protein 1 (HAAT family) [Herbaspirillum sp. 